MGYTVPGMTLINQTMKMSCWYASAQMLIQWRRNRMQASEANIVDPSEDAAIAKIRDDNKGVLNPQIIQLAQTLGLVPIPPMSPSEEALESWLKQYGPLWVNGKNHIVVIAGVSDGSVLVYDPAPRFHAPEWRSLAGWYVGGQSSSSRDTASDVQAVFLHCPFARNSS